MERGYLSADLEDSNNGFVVSLRIGAREFKREIPFERYRLPERLTPLRSVRI